jgi:Raf kinase inhibitor-like YbhB/YbcL family protein
MSTVGEKVSNAGKLIRRTIGSALSGVHAGDEKIQVRQQGTRGSLTLTSTAFAAGGRIPDRFTPQGENVSPDLAWSGVPAGARELVLIVEDPDAPFPNPFVHWILYGLSPTVTSLPTGVPTTTERSQFGAATQSTNDAKTVGYYGPQPPLGHGVHHYHFQLFALDTILGLGTQATVADLAKAMQGHVLADGEIVGTYERK